MNTRNWPISKSMGLHSKISLLLVLALVSAPRVSFAATDLQAAIEKIENSHRSCIEKAQKASSNERAIKAAESCEKIKSEAMTGLQKKVEQDYENSECGKAEYFAGTSAKGQECKNTMRAIKEVQSRNALTTTVGTTTFGMASQMAAMSSSGTQAGTQKAAKTVFQGAASVKLLEAASQGYGAKQLMESANKAEASSKKFARLHEQVSAKCPANMANRNQCARDAIDEIDSSLTPHEKMNTLKLLAGASEQSAEAAEAAKRAAINSGATGAINALVGLQAMQAAKRAGQNAVAVAPPRNYSLIPSTGASAGPVVGGSSALPDDFGALGSSAGLLGPGYSGGIRDRPSSGALGAGSAPFVSRKSTVSSGGSIAGAGAASKGPGKPTRKGAKSYSSSVGEFPPGGGGGGLGYNKGGGNDNSNPFADALSKLFGADGTGDPAAIEGAQGQQRGLASNGEEEGSEVFAVDVSLFEQITTKYRQLRANGSI